MIPSLHPHGRSQLSEHLPEDVEAILKFLEILMELPSNQYCHKENSLV